MQNSTYQEGMHRAPEHCYSAWGGVYSKLVGAADRVSKKGAGSLPCIATLSWTMNTVLPHCLLS